jgi:hypothetical protein
MSDADGEAGPPACDGTMVGVEEEDYGEGSSSACDRLRDMVVPDDTRRFARHACKLYPLLWPEVRRAPSASQLCPFSPACAR